MDAHDSFPLDRPAPLGRTLVLIVLALGTGAGITHWLESRGKTNCTGFLQARSSLISAPGDVRIERIVAEEGASVEPGQPLLIVRDERMRGELERRQQLVAQLQRQLEQAGARAEIDLAWRMKNLDSELHAARIDSARFLQAQFDQRVQVQAWQEYVAGDLVASRITHDEFISALLNDSRLSNEGRLRALLEEESARNALEVATAQLELCDQRVTELERLKQELPRNIARAAGVDDLQAQLETAAAELAQLQSRSPEIALDAPAYGTVGVYRVEPGGRVDRGGTIVEILDQERRCLHVQVASRDLARFAAGAEVELIFPGGERRAGIVRNIPPQTTGASVSDALATLIIDPTGKLWPEIPIGSAVEVTTKR